MSDLKSEVMAVLVPQILMICGREMGSEVVDAVTLALAPYDLTKTERNLVVYDGTDKGLIGRYFVAKQAIGLSPNSLNQYRKTLSDFLATVQKHIKDITTEDVRLYITRKKMSGAGACYQNNIRLCLSSFFSFLHEEGLISLNPISRIKKIRQPKVVKEPFTEQEVEQMRNATDNLRDKAIIDFLFSTGCRVSEMTGVDKSDVDWDKGRVLVKGKGSKFRWVYLNARASVSLKAYLDSRTDSAMALFVGKSGSRKDPDKNPARLAKSGVEVMVRTLGKSLGIEKVHPHRFRRTAATVALRRGMPIEQVSKILGHASLNTTTIYANSTQDDLAIAHRKYLS